MPSRNYNFLIARPDVPDVAERLQRFLRWECGLFPRPDDILVLPLATSGSARGLDLTIQRAVESIRSGGEVFIYNSAGRKSQDLLLHWGRHKSLHVRHLSVNATEAALRHCIQTRKIDAISQLEQKLPYWLHATVTPASLRRWIRQFYALNLEFVAQILVRCLDVWAPSRLQEALSHIPFGEKTVLSTLSDKGSDSLLIHLLTHKQRAAGFAESIHRPGALLNHVKFGGTVHLVTDHILTGSEIIDYFYPRLEASPVPQRDPCSIGSDQISGDCIPIVSSGAGSDFLNAIRSHRSREAKIVIYAAFITRLGRERVTAFLRQANLAEDQAYLDLSHSVILENLSAVQRSAADDGCLFGPDLVGLFPEGLNPIPELTLRLEELGVSANQQYQTLESLKEIGFQLMKTLPRSDEMNSPAWGLGAGGLGLTTILPHTQAVSLLPVLWLKGPVLYRGKSIAWEPLLPVAPVANSG